MKTKVLRPIKTKYWAERTAMNAYAVAEMGCAEQAELLTPTLGPLAREAAAAITQ